MTKENRKTSMVFYQRGSPNWTPKNSTNSSIENSSRGMRAVAEAKFPTDENRTLKPEEHVIRLITRLLFIWFIKEKGLGADALFNC